MIFFASSLHLQMRTRQLGVVLVVVVDVVVVDVVEVVVAVVVVGSS